MLIYKPNKLISYLIVKIETQNCFIFHYYLNSHIYKYIYLLEYNKLTNLRIKEKCF